MDSLIIDGHEDIAWNMMNFGRDYRRSVAETREIERGQPVIEQVSHTTLGRDAWLQGRVAVIFSVVFACPMEHRYAEWDRVCYRDPAEAHRLVSEQLDAYHRLADEGDVFRLIGNQGDLKEVLASWQADEGERQIGFVPLMEGADPILEPPQVEEWYGRGIRMIGPAWKATRYAGGTGEPGPLTALGFELLEQMGNFKMGLDLSHLAEKAYFQAVEAYAGTIFASHSNPRRFFPDNRKDRGLSDEMIEVLAARDGVIGVVLYNRFLNPNFQPDDSKEAVSLWAAVDAIDHICQVTGNTGHVGIGSDLDGGFGWSRTPAEINTVADLRKLGDMLKERGYTDEHLEAIYAGNWLRMLGRVLPP